MIYYLYKITNRLNNKCYLGITNNPTVRWTKHRQVKLQTAISLAIQKYGQENFEFKILVIGDEAYIKGLEIKAIAAFNTKAPNGYNLTDGGEGSLGYYPSATTIEKKRIAGHKRRHSFSTKQKISASQRGVRTGDKNSHAKPVIIAGKKYECLRHACKDLNLSYKRLVKRLGSIKFADYQYM